MAGSDFTLPALERGLGISKVVGISGIGGGGGRLMVVMCESRDLGRGWIVDPGRDALIPTGNDAIPRTLFAVFGRVSIDGLGPTLAFGLYKDSYRDDAYRSEVVGLDI